MAQANIELAQQDEREAIARAREAGVSEEMISNVRRSVPESQEVPTGEVTEPVEIQQEVPVGSEFTTDFARMNEADVEQIEPSENVQFSLFGRATEVQNPWIKRVVGEEINDPVIYQSKINKVTALEMQINGTSFEEARARARAALENTDIESVMAGYKAQMADELEMQWQEYIRTASPEEIVSYAQFKKEHSLVEAYEGKSGTEQLFVDTFGGLTLDEEREANEVVKNYAGTLLQDRIDEVSGVEWGTSVLGLFVPDYLKDINDLMDVGLFDTKEAYFNFIEGFKAATPDQKVRILDIYVPKVWEAFEQNPLKATAAVNILFDENHEAAFWIDTSFDALDVTGFGMDIVKIGGAAVAYTKFTRKLKQMRDSNSLSNMKLKFRDIDNPSAAAEVTAASKADETGDIQKGNNQTEVDEASDVNAMNTESVTPNSVDGLADAHTRLFEQVKYNRTASPFQQNFLSKLERSQMEAMARGERALATRYRKNIAKIKQQLAGMPKARIRTVAPDEAAELFARGWKVADRTEDSVRMIKAGDESLRLQKNLAKELHKLNETVKLEREINDMLRFSDVARTTDDGAQALARGEVPEGAEQLVKTKADETEALYKGLTSNAADAVKAGLTRESAEALVQNIRSKTQHLLEGMDNVMPEMLTGAERKAVEDATLEKLQKEAADSGKVIKSVDITERTRKGFKAKITYEGGSYTERVTFTENNLGDLGVAREDIKTGVTNMWPFNRIFSPEHQFDAADHTGRFGGLVRDATFAGDQASRIKRSLNAIGQGITDGLSRSQRNQLDRLILASDEASTQTERLFTIKELREGVETAAGTEIIDPKVIESYFQMHIFLGEIKRLMDWSVRRSLELKGYKNINLNGKDGFKQNIVKPIKNWGTVDFTEKQKLLVYDEATETWQTAAAGEIVRRQDDLRGQGYQLVEFFSKQTDSAGNVTSHGLIPPDPRVAKITALPSRVINQTPGMYIPRVYKAGYYYVRDANDARKTTVMAFERRTDAENWVKKQNETGKNYVVRQDGDMGYEESLIALAQGYGGLYTSARKRENLKLVAAGKDPDTVTGRPERLGGISSVQRYLDATGNMMPMAEQRVAAIRRFENQLDAVAKTYGFQKGLETPGDFNSRIMLPDGTPEKALFENMRDFLRGTYGTMSSSEKAYQGLMTSIAEYMEKGYKYPVIGQITESARKFAVDLAHADVRRKLLGATFDAHLGWFNGAQLYVQAQNAALAASMYPFAAAKAIPQAMSARTIILVSNDPQLGDLAKVASKGFGISSEEFADTVRAFRRSGLYDSVMRVADYGGKAAGIGGTALDKFRMAAKAGRIFYEEGELSSRLVSFFIAKENLKKRLGRSFDLKDDKIIKQLSDETYRIMMNMQKENAAWWQNNWLGIPLQFAQVQAKLIENILPVAFGGSKRWTAKEKMKVLTGQVLLYGTVGVPLIEQTTQYMADTLGVEPRELKENNPLALEFIQEGFTGMISAALGFENNFSDRGSIVKGLDDNALGKFISAAYRTAVYKDDEVKLQDFLGASLNTFYRTKEAGDQLVESIRHIFYKPTGQVVIDELLAVSDAVAGITSTWSNVEKAKYLHSIGLTSNNGNLLIPADQFNVNNISRIARVMGFPYDPEVAYYNRTEAQKSHLRDWTFIRQSVKRRMTEEMVNPGDRELYQKDINFLTAPLTEIERDQMMSRIIDEVVSGKSGYDKQMNQELRMYLSGALEKAPIQGVE